ncbi:MAG: hypothetical protein ACR2RD_07755 [Woeseiaceae bacterium]
MAHSNNNPGKSILRRRVPWFAIVPIALLQLTIAVHQFDHVDEFGEGACHVCVQLDRVDAAVDHPAEAAPPQLVEFLRSHAPVVSIARSPVRNFDSRAPPQL